MKVSRIGSVRCKLGEGPLWDVEEQALYFVDVLGNKLWRYKEAGDTFESWGFETSISSLALAKDGGAIVSLQSGFHHFDFTSGKTTFISNPTKDNPTTQLNDGKVDARGRFIVGSVDISMATNAGLFSLAPDLSVTQLDDNLQITNGPCWSPDQKTLYLANSLTHNIYAYDYVLETGLVSNRRTFTNTADSGLGGIPDGATVDTQGRLWTAMCDGAKIACFDTQGQLVQAIDFPTGQVSSVMFGGRNLDRLYVTSIDAGALASIKAAEGAVYGPDEIGGGLFVIDGLEAKGLPEHRFGTITPT